MTEHRFKKQIELLGLRQQAARLAVRLFEDATTQQDIDLVSHWFEICNQAATKDEVVRAIHELTMIAKAKNISLDI